MPIKVAVFGHSAALAGAELSLVFCVRRMHAAGMQVTVYLPRFGPLVSRIHEIHKDIRVEIIPLRWWMRKRHSHVAGLLRTTQALWDTVRIFFRLKKSTPSIILVISSVTPAPLLASKLLKIPSILTLGESVKSNPTLKSVLPKRLILWIIHKISFRVLACSQYVACQYKRACEVSYPEIDEFVVGQPTARALVKPKIVMLGSYSSEKGQELALRVSKELEQKGFQHTLDFYGWGDEKLKKSLEHKVKKYELIEIVNFNEPTKDVFGVLKNATLSFVFSKNEAFGKVTLESLSQGTPVIGLDAGGTSEILQKGGGLLVTQNPSQVAQVVMDLCHKPERYRLLQLEAISNPILYQIEGTRRDICSHIYEIVGEIKKGTGKHALEN